MVNNQTLSKPNRLMGRDVEQFDVEDKRGKKRSNLVLFWLTRLSRVILFRCPWIWSYSKIKGQLTAVKRFVPVQFENVPPGLSLKKTSWVVSRRKSNLCILLLMTKSRSCLGFCIAVDPVWFIENFRILFYSIQGPFFEYLVVAPKNLVTLFQTIPTRCHF